MLNFLNENNKNLAKKIEGLKTVEERSVAMLAISFEIFKMVTEKENIVGKNDPLYISLVKDIAYDLNELVIIDIDQVLNYANKFLELKGFRFEGNLDSSNTVGELFGIDKILGNSIVDLWNSNFDLFKAVRDLYFISDVHSQSLKTLENKGDNSDKIDYAVEQPRIG